MNEKDIPSIWAVPAFLPYIHPPLTPEIIEAAEAKIGYRLPKEYIDLLYMQNGGHIRYKIPDTGNRMIYGIGPYSPGITQFERLKEYEGAVSFDVNDLVPFDEDGDWYFCLDYRKNKSEPAITMIVTESDYEINIAANFKEYLQKLVISIDHELVYDIGQSIEELIQQFSHAFNVEFKMTDSYNSGYPIYHAPYDDVRISIKSNNVPRGFLRERDSCHEGYLSLKDEMTELYPGIPATALIITPSTGDREKIFNDLAAKGFSIKRIEEYYQ
jgi:hypothetical protein